MTHVIFYSWQADLPNNTNRSVIQTALEEAAKALADDTDIEPVIERDTQNVPGSPDIAQTIFKKISASHVFVADVTLINPASSERRTPNPNVLLELGYAMRALGDDRIILVMNTSYGRIEDLPFDLKMRRVIAYHISADAKDKATERKRLAGILKTALSAAIDAIPEPQPEPNAIDAAITGIETGAPNKILLVRKAMQDVTTQLEVLAPPLFRYGGTDEQLVNALDQTIPAVREFTRLAITIASMNDHDSARAVYKGFSAILEHYDNPKGFSGASDVRDFDYWKFLGQELLVTLIAALLQEERYDIISGTLDDTITVPNIGGRTAPATYDYANDYLRSLDKLKDLRRRLSYHADLLHQRHAPKGREQAQDGPLADVLPFELFSAADYLLYLRGELSPDEPPTSTFVWVPWTSVYLNETPGFIHNAIRASTAQALAHALGVKDFATLKTRLADRAGRIAIVWRDGRWSSPLTTQEIERIGSR